MALFEVPGWSVPTAPVPSGSNSRKRKRPAHESEAKPDEKIHAAAVNVEKLLAKLGEGEGQQAKKKAKKDKEKRKAQAPPAPKREPNGAQAQQKKGKAQERKDESRPAPPVAGGSKKNKKNKGKQAQQQETKASSPAPDPAPTPKPAQKGKNASAEKGLTALQANMKHSLDGARFRWINETLYKSDSEHAHQMMRENPSVFDEYHTGFRHQVQSWPKNPVAHYISVLSQYPAKTVVADLGCGDAALAKELVPRGYTVLSFDLVSDGAYVVAADTCTRIPLPGSEAEGADDAQVVDVVVCALSLMSVNWVGCIREAWRILRTGGELKIAEVASRFTEVEAFVSLVSSVGFRLKSKDDSNTHFTLFEFSKVQRKEKSEKEWSKLIERGSVLKPCEYKRR
ncbi:methyltransferase-domain-containing protein [Phanerochaete sordida]|uniref:Ribosomal RNA-processing protein 8 n=1 Tax=Phanerochaete sordida TaxID=48140 RepID=A0A9P3FZF5_9APHY|nr:methyltransferase-domain-containing protein [Phanerochaete sordida]